jgi:hypothetical protein
LILIILCVTGPFCASYGQTTTVLFDFESGTVGDWTVPAWPPGSSLVADSAHPHGGTYALRCGHVTYAAWFFADNASLPTNDLSGFDTISYWVRSDHYNTGNDWIKIVLKESSGEIWAQEYVTYVTSAYQQVRADLLSTYVSTNGFAVESGGVNWELELTNIVEMRFVISRPADSGNAAYTNYYIDDIELVRNPAVAELSLSTDALAFGTLSPSPSDHRFMTGPVYVDYTVTGYTNTWRIELYSSHASGAMGLIGQQNAAYSMPLKCWYSGASAAPPDPETDSEWANNWAYVTDETNTWHPSPAVSTNSPLASGFQVRFATDASGIYTQTYGTPVTVELMIE